jgi:predicted transporter
MLSIINGILQSKSLKVKWVLSVMLAMSLWSLVDGKKARVKKGKKNRGDMSSAVMFVGVIFALTFVPLIGYFIYNVWNDPLTPSLVKNGTELIKEKTMGFLSKRKTAEENEQKDD